MAFREFRKDESTPDVEMSVLEHWETHETFRASVEGRPESKRFIFFEGPPTANGHPGTHHVLARTIKDIVCRYKTMRGFRVERKAGWDTHGLPVEIEVEKELDLESKEEIEAYGVGRFTEKCLSNVFVYKDEWDQLTRRMAYWIDLSDPYVTCTNDFIESVWHILRLMWDRDLIYKGHKILPYCPRCGTPLSSHEVAQGYTDAEDPSVFVRMKLKADPDTSFLVWTTTPWTLISNVALAVAPGEDYVKVSTAGEKLILAEALTSVLDDDFEVLERMKGSELLDTEYEPLYSFVPFKERGHYVIGADFVTLEDGTGIVHIAPAFGEDDNRMGRELDLPFIQPVDGAGRFTSDVEPWAGKFIKDADPLIMDELKSRGLLYKRATIVHTYPFCWRCDSPLIYYARDSWYVRTTAVKDQMMANNREIDWHPKEIGLNRLGDWLENNVDWAVSRDRYWGTPLNIWTCGKCGAQASVGSVDELASMAVRGYEPGMDLHKPAIDGVFLKCPDCGGEMERTPEVIDCWFDTGSMPYAQWHWPFENADKFDEQFPADFIAEGVDQTRGWFYSLLAISTIVSGTSSFKRCVVNDMVLDLEGKKMSKSRGNAVDSFEVMDTDGADALRWYLMSASPPWLPKRFDPAGVKEVASKVVDTLRNTYGFFSLYANIDGYDPGKHSVPLDKRSVTDRWIISRLNSTVSEVVSGMDGYDITRSVRRLQNFVLEDVSNWYVRLSRSRFWKGEMDEDKAAAYSTLREVLLTVAKAMAPFAPFISDAVYMRMKDGGAGDDADSVHLCDFPEPVEDLIDTELEEAMDLVRSIVQLGRAARNSSAIKVRQPLSRLLVSGVAGDRWGGVEGLSELVLAELNVKELVWAVDADLSVRRADPVFPALGPKHGKNVNDVAEVIRALPPEEADRLAAGESVTAAVGEESVEVESGDVEISMVARPGLAVESSGDMTVALDTKMTDGLRDEGFAREMINKIQFMRKEAGFDVVDRINVYYEASPRLKSAIEKFVTRIASETLAESVSEGGSEGELAREWDINGERARIAVERLV